MTNTQKPSMPRSQPPPTQPAGGDPPLNRLLLIAALLLALSSFLLLASILNGCAPLSPAGQVDNTSDQVAPDIVRSIPMPAWAWPVDEWLNMDWDLWSCPTAKGC